jgi:MTA/SAH nucleosidase
VKIAIMVPMAEEAEYYHTNFQFNEIKKYGITEYSHGFIGNNEVFIGLSGIGKVNAAMNITSLLVNEKIDLIFITGSAGALQTNIHQYDLVCPDAFRYFDVHNTMAGDYVEGQIPQEPAEYDLNSMLRDDFIKYLQAKKIRYFSGLAVTGDSFIATFETKNGILKNFPDALCVEMEGAAFAQVASKFGVPLVALRAISDNAANEAAVDFDIFVKNVAKKAASIICDYLKN